MGAEPAYSEWKRKYFKLEGAVSRGQREARDDQKGNEILENLKSVKRRKTLSDGVYVKGTVQGQAVLFAADSGASKTVIGKHVYDKLDIKTRPKLNKSVNLMGPSGTSLKQYGKGYFDITLGPVVLKQELVVADIEDEALLGVDILQNNKSGPADMLLSKGKLLLLGKEIPLIQVGLPGPMRAVRAANDFTIPPQSETVIDVLVDREESDDLHKTLPYLIEPTEHFHDEYPLQMARVLADLNMGVTSKVRVLNPFPTSVTIKQDAVVGQAEAVEGIQSVITGQEHELEQTNNCSVRRIHFEGARKTSSQQTTNTGSTEIPEHLHDLYKTSVKGLDPRESKKLATMLHRFQDCFSRHEWDIGLTNLTEHSINTGNAVPIKQRPRRVPLAFANEEKKAIEDLLAKGVIRESTSAWASPIVLVRKKSGAVRPCVDYRRINQLVPPDGYPMPRVQDCLDAVAGAKLFSTFDLTSGYFQIPLKESDIPKSAFVCKFGQYEMTRMPFGLNNSCNTFQRTMELALQGLQWETCLIYIDDVIVYGTSFEEHMERITQVLERIESAGLKLRPDKCTLLQSEVVFLGHVVSAEGIKPNPSNISKIMEWPAPKSVKEIRQFIAMGSYYRKFVKNFAKIVRPMVDLTKKDKPFIWTSACQAAFEELKTALVSPPIMGYPLQDAGKFILDVDASDVGIGGVLHQVQEGQERVISYGSRALNKAEKNYCITEKELLAVRYFVEYYRQYLLGRHFTVRTDHQALRWLFRLKEPKGKTARWIEILSQYNFDIEYRQGKRQGHCDALSRCSNPRDCDCPDVDTMEPLKCGPCKKCLKRSHDMMLQGLYDKVQFPTQKDAEETGSRGPISDQSETIKPVRPQSDIESQSITYSWTWAGGLSLEEIRKLQENDPDINPIITAKRAGKRPNSDAVATCSPATRHYWVIWDMLSLRDGVLYRSFTKKDGTGEYLQFVVPRDMKKDILRQMHDSLLSGHFGCKKRQLRRHCSDSTGMV